MLPKHKYLLSYRYAEIIHDLTVVFCDRYIDKHSRTHDQMVQAARSGKQNIVEGVGLSDTSKKSEIKLIGVAHGSIEELGKDYEDFLRQKNLPRYVKESPQISAFRKICYRLSDLRNLSDVGEFLEKPVLPGNPTDAANFLLTLCHIDSYLLSKQVESLKRRFMEKGGLTEELFQSRINFRKSLK